MSLSKVKQSIHTKIVRGKDGLDYLVSFLVIESEAGIDFKVLSAKKIVQSIKQKNILCLPISFLMRNFIAIKADVINGIKLPYSSIESFFVSQPTRAPSFI